MEEPSVHVGTFTRGQEIQQHTWHGWSGGQKKHSNVFLPTGAEEDREMEVYQQGLRTGKLNRCQVSGRHLVPSQRTGVLPKGCTGLGYWNWRGHRMALKFQADWSQNPLGAQFVCALDVCSR